MLKLLSTLEIPVLDKPPKLLILVKLQQIPRVTMRSHEKKNRKGAEISRKRHRRTYPCKERWRGGRD
jgi:hypothetical protein